MLDDARKDEILAATRIAPCFESFGIDSIELEEGFARVRARHRNKYDGLPGGFHGGMMAAVADCIAWLAIATHTGPAEPMLTTDLSLRYLAPCTTDLTATARLLKPGRTLCPVAVELYDAGGTQVATGAVCYIRLTNLRNFSEPPPDPPPRT